jgi:hypothetical protein
MLAPTTSGRLGAHLLTAFIDAGWIIRTPGQRAVSTSSEITGEPPHDSELGKNVGLARPDAEAPEVAGATGRAWPRLSPPSQWCGG